MKRRRIVFLGATILIIAVVIILCFFLCEDSYEKIPYSQFNKYVLDGRVEKVTIESDKLIFSIDSDKKLYETDNPGSLDLAERLLLSDVEVENNQGGTDIFYLVMDILFDVVFVAFIGGIVYVLVFKLSKDFKVVHHTKVRFEDIAGMDDVKKDMKFIVDVLKNPGKFKDSGVRTVKGVILEGPPGNGKTLFAKALATESKVNFIATKGADFQSALMAVGSMKIRTLFKKARKHSPCIVFIDEFDGIGERRNYAGTGIDKENNRIITAMLNEMDGFKELEGVLVIAATNSYASLDRALVRPGRFDVKIRVPNPNQATILELIDLYTKDKKIDETTSREELSHEFKGMSCAAIEATLNEAAMNVKINGREKITMADIENAIKLTLSQFE